MDESGVHIHRNSRVFTFAGYLAPAEEWDRFTPKWNAALEGRVDCFHAFDCSRLTKEFEKFKGREDERDALLDELAGVINEHEVIGVGASIIKRDYEDVVRGELKERFESHYQFAMQTSFVEMAIVMDFHEVDEKERIASFFDRQDQFGPRALTLFNEIVEDTRWENRYRFKTLTYASKRDCIPLQAADMIAYYMNREMHRRLYSPDKEQDWVYTKLTKGRQFKAHYWDRKALEDHVRRISPSMRDHD